MATSVRETAEGIEAIDGGSPNAAGKSFGPSAYDPEREAHGIDSKDALEASIRTPDSFRLSIRESVLSLSKSRPRARSVEVEVRKGMSARTVREAIMTRTSEPRFRESAFDLGQDPTAGFVGDNPEQEFLQILGGPYSKQMYLSAFLEAQAKCFWELHHNPLAAAFVQIQTTAIVGRGVPFKARDPKFQAVWDEWARRDRYDRRLRWTAHDFGWQGEVLWRPFASENGLVTVRLLDPSTIWEVIAEPSDTEIVHGYWQQYPGPWNIYTMLVNGRQVPQTEYVIRLIPSEDVIHVKANEAYGEKRGRSDFYPALSWMKRFRDYMNARVTAAQFERSFVWDVTVDGDSSDVQAAINDPAVTKVPKPGGAWWHNKQIIVQPMSAKVGGQGDAPSGTALDLVRTIAAAVGIPVEYLGWGDASTKAQAITATAPWPVRIQARQRQLETELLIPFSEKLWRIGMAFGLDVGETWEGEFTWPEPVREDIDARMKRLAFLLDTGVIGRRTYATMAAAEANITSYDYERAQAEIASDSAAAQALGQSALDRDAARIAAERLDGRRPMGAEDRAAANDNDRTLRPSAPVTGDGDGNDAS